jgi:hypothetical protein
MGSITCQGSIETGLTASFKDRVLLCPPGEQEGQVLVRTLPIPGEAGPVETSPYPKVEDKCHLNLKGEGLRQAPTSSPEWWRLLGLIYGLPCR